MSLDLTRARVIEFDATDVRLTVIRTHQDEMFRVAARDGRPQLGYQPWMGTEITDIGRNITVLAEFPLTLADLIPDGCTAFQFLSKNRVMYAAIRSGSSSQLPGWSITDVRGKWDDLNDLAIDANVDLTTVIPLKVDDSYVEERR